MTNVGIDDILRDLKAMGDGADGVQEAMITAGIEIVKEEWTKSAERHKHRDTGAMIKSIGPSKIRRDGNAISADIYPQGKDKKGVRNAEKAFILNYGTSRIKASHWVQEADAAAEPRIGEAYQKIWDEYLENRTGG